MGAMGLMFGLAIACGLCALVAGILITAALDRRGLKTPFPLVGALLFRNVSRYREITRAETGQVGRLFYVYVIGINAALVLAIAAALLGALG